MQRMNRISLFFAISGMVLSGSSHAADLAVNTPLTDISKPPVYDWTGSYIGGHVGYGWGSTSNAFSLFESANPAVRDPWLSDGDITYGGIIGGGHVGYLFQGAHNLVFGLEAEISGTGIRGDDERLGGARNARAFDYFGTVKGRLGVAFDRSLIFATGGFAYGRATAEAEAAPDTKSVSGWTVGAGYEHAIDDRWRARLQYQYVDFGSMTFTHAEGYLSYDHRSDRLSFQSVQAGISYRF